MKYWDAAGGRELALLAPSYIFASSWRQLESDERGTNGWLEYFRMNGRIMSGVQLFLSPITNEGTEVLYGYSKIFVCRNDFYRFSGCLTLEKNYIYIYTFWDWCNIERYFGDVQRRNIMEYDIEVSGEPMYFVISRAYVSPPFCAGGVCF